MFLRGCWKGIVKEDIMDDIFFPSVSFFVKIVRI